MLKNTNSPCQYVRDHYGVPACIGRRVTMNGRPGIIAEDRGHHIGINFDSDKPGHISPAHPTWKVEYLGMGTIRPMTRAQRRYKRWLQVGDCFENFRSFIVYETRREKEGRIVIIERNKIEAAIAAESAGRPGTPTVDICEAVAASLGIPTGYVFEVADDCMDQEQQA